MKYGLQLFSVRDAAEKDYEATLAKVAEMGYKMVEPAGFFDHSADEVAAMLKKYDLEVCSTHTPAHALFENFEETVAYHKAIGCYDIIIPWGAYETKPEMDAFIDKINHYLPLLKKEGIRLHYHNHSAELLPNKDGEKVWFELYERTDIMFQIDTFWIYNARLDPAEFIEKYRDRISHVHLKDGLLSPNTSDIKTLHTGAARRSLGSGTAPVEAVRKKAIELGFKMVVESEGLDPCGLDEVKRCIDYLHTLDAKD